MRQLSTRDEAFIRSVDKLIEHWAEVASMEATDAAICFLHGKYEDAFKAMRRANNAIGHMKQIRKESNRMRSN